MLERPEVARGGGGGNRPLAAASLPGVSKSRFFTFFLNIFFSLLSLPPAPPSPGAARVGRGAGGCNLPAGQGRPPAGGRSGAAAAIGRGAERHLLGSLMRVTPGLGGDI